MERSVKRLRITGGVQGVGYRYFFLHTANSLGLTGWVRNRRDGSVEAVIQGDEKSVEEMIARARRGPSTASVGDVEVSLASGDFGSFEIEDTV